jgi:hypothetical protein
MARLSRPTPASTAPNIFPAAATVITNGVVVANAEVLRFDRFLGVLLLLAGETFAADPGVDGPNIVAAFLGQML